MLTVSYYRKNILFYNKYSSGWSSPSTNKAVESLVQSGFYDALGLGARDRITGGIAQTVSGVLDNRQVVLNFAPSHQADYCYLLLQEAGAEVIGSDGNPMHSTSYAMLSIAPSYNGDKSELKQKFVEAMKSDLVKGEYKGWAPKKVVLKKVTE